VDTSDTNPRRFARQLHELMGLVNHAAGAGALERMVTHQLTLPQMVSLHVLRYSGPLSTLRLMDHLHLSASATSSLVDKLVERGWVARRENVEDRRQRTLVVTDAALAMLDEMAEARAREFETAFSRVEPVLQARLAEVFEEVIVQMRRGGAA
jgi:DNA-binding MarR family transcriptional regulator